MSAAELANRVAVSANTVSNWRTGKIKPPGAVMAYLKLYVQVKRMAQ